MASLNIDEDQLLAVSSTFDEKLQKEKAKQQTKMSSFDEEGSGVNGSGQNIEF